MIPFSRPTLLEDTQTYMAQCFEEGHFSGHGKFNHLCEDYFQNQWNTPLALLTTSCTSALEMAAIMANIGPGDEVIVPSFTFVTSAAAFCIFGAKIVFVDVDPRTMNVDPASVEKAITNKTKIILCVHYGGVACDMNALKKLADKHNLLLVEDAAQCAGAKYKDQYLGTIGHIGCMSFHQTKNIHCGEGGAIFINDPSLVDKAHITYNKGTNRKEFLEGRSDKYSWIDKGMSFELANPCAALLYPQLLALTEINRQRLLLWNLYEQRLSQIFDIELAEVPTYASHNAHLFYFKTDRRKELIRYLNSKGIQAQFHYPALHLTRGGKKFGRVAPGGAPISELESERLLRLPLYHGLESDEVERICKEIKTFYGESS